MKNNSPFILSILSGLLLAISFPNVGSLTPVIFIALVPLLSLSNQRKGKNNFGYYYIAFTIFNGISGFWVCIASFFGGIGAALVNALLMTLVFQLFDYSKKHLSSKLATLTLICGWLAFECFHNSWDLSWSWFNLGNTFASSVNWVQWYEYVGVQGGTLWVLIVNLVVFQIVNNKQAGCEWKFLIPKITLAILLVTIPILVSYKIVRNYKEPDLKAHFVVVQPNYDAYNEKFLVPVSTQLNLMTKLYQSKVTDTTSFVLFPETAIPNNIWTSDFEKSRSIKMIKSSLKNKTQIITGSSLLEPYFNAKSKPTVTARKYDGLYFDSFNSALQISKKGVVEYYHKSKLVPGVEKLPFPTIFGFFENFAINLGGESGSLGTQNEREVFVNGNVKMAPVICYESIYGQHVNGYINKRANIIGIITNDGWWSDTPGYKQHWQFAKLRAIETRRSIVRSANTGISGFINQKGEVLQQSIWDEEIALSETLSLNDKVTFYAKHGDYLYRLASFLSVILLLFSFVRSKQN